MYVRSDHDTEIRLTLEAMVDLLNALADGDRPDEDPADLREILVHHEFARAATAPMTAIARVEERTRAMSDVLSTLPNAEPSSITTWINTELDGIHIMPSLTEHDGAGLHIHWTPANASFDDQVVADFLMALANEVCDHGTDRFGICAATDCEHLFFDTTRNGSRRFCADPRCASRTHTADHRARQRTN
ncbi:MAG: CGNR zinc finger domain-containing protein [Ilumatobacteraceae bacterium]